MMKKLLTIFTLVFTLLFIGCFEEGPDQDKKIDKTAQDAKDILEQLSVKAKEFLDDEQNVEKLKEAIDEIAAKSKDMQKNSEVWKEKIEELKKDPEIREILEKHKGDAEELGKRLEEIFKDIEKNSQK